MTPEVLGAFGAFRVNSSRAFAYNLYQGCRELTSDLVTSDSCSWARASDGSTDQSARGDTVGYHANAYTIDFGGQVGLSDRLALVGSLGYESNGFHGDDGASHIEGNAALAGVGVNFVDGALELSGAIDGAYGWYRSYRTITVGLESAAADASPRQWQIGLHVRGGYEIPIGGPAYVKPFLDGHVIRVSNESFTEGGSSPFRLTVDGRTDNAVQGGAGLELGLHIPTHSGVVVHPFVSAAVEFGQDGQWTTNAHFASQSAAQGFSVRTAVPGTLGKFGIGADLVNAKNLSFSILYEPEIGDGYNYQGGAARISYRF
jgi:outer membrane autotransporter protein